MFSAWLPLVLPRLRPASDGAHDPPAPAAPTVGVPLLARLLGTTVPGFAHRRGRSRAKLRTTNFGNRPSRRPRRAKLYRRTPEKESEDEDDGPGRGPGAPLLPPARGGMRHIGPRFGHLVRAPGGGHGPRGLVRAGEVEGRRQ